MTPESEDAPVAFVLTGEPRVIFARHQIDLALCQVRFPRILRISESGAVAPFQDAIRNDFPTLVEEQQFGLVVGPEGVSQVPAAKAWRFYDRRREWSVVLATDFIALETRFYT